MYKFFFILTFIFFVGWRSQASVDDPSSKIQSSSIETTPFEQCNRYNIHFHANPGREDSYSSKNGIHLNTLSQRDDDRIERELKMDMKTKVTNIYQTIDHRLSQIESCLESTNINMRTLNAFEDRTKVAPSTCSAILMSYKSQIMSTASLTRTSLSLANIDYYRLLSSGAQDCATQDIPDLIANPLSDLSKYFRGRRDHAPRLDQKEIASIKENCRLLVKKAQISADKNVGDAALERDEFYKKRSEAIQKHMIQTALTSERLNLYVISQDGSIIKRNPNDDYMLANKDELDLVRLGRSKMKTELERFNLASDHLQCLYSNFNTLMNASLGTIIAKEQNLRACAVAARYTQNCTSKQQTNQYASFASTAGGAVLGVVSTPLSLAFGSIGALSMILDKTVVSAHSKYQIIDEKLSTESDEVSNTVAVIASLGKGKLAHWGSNVLGSYSEATPEIEVRGVSSLKKPENFNQDQILSLRKRWLNEHAGQNDQQLLETTISLIFDYNRRSTTEGGKIEPAKLEACIHRFGIRQINDGLLAGSTLQATTEPLRCLLE